MQIRAGVFSLSCDDLHFYYALPDGVKLKNSAGVLGPGIDVRSEGGYVVARPN